MIPAQAFGLKQYLLGAFSSKICDKEHAAPSLGDSEVLAVQDSPRDVHRPDVCQRVNDSGEVGASVAAEGSGDVFPNSEIWFSITLPQFADYADRLKKQATSFTGQAGAIPSHGQVLAWTPERHHVHRGKVMGADGAHVREQLGLRKPMTEDPLSGGVNLTHERAGKTRALES